MMYKKHMYNKDNIDSEYMVPMKYISCPGCGQKYGHHNTKVDIISQECSSCVKQWGYEEFDLVPASEFISIILDNG